RFMESSPLEGEVEPEQGRPVGRGSAVAGVLGEAAEFQVDGGLRPARQLERMPDGGRPRFRIASHRTGGGIRAARRVDELVPADQADARVDGPDTLQESADEGRVADGAVDGGLVVLAAPEHAAERQRVDRAEEVEVRFAAVAEVVLVIRPGPRERAPSV